MSKSATRASAESTPSDSSKKKTHTQSKHVTNHARLGATSGAREQSRGKLAATRSAPLLMTAAGTAVSESGGRTAGGVRCRSCSA